MTNFPESTQKRDFSCADLKRRIKGRTKTRMGHWFFSFAHNRGLSKEKLRKIVSNTPKGTKIYKNKIEGLRGKATGLVFPGFDRKKHVISAEWLHRRIEDEQITFQKFTAGLDTAYSSKSSDTIAMIFQGITTERKLITLAENVINNTDLNKPIAPSDVTVRLVSFLEQCRKEWGFAKDIFIDSADQATMTELAKYKRLNGCLYNFWNAYKTFGILDRIRLQQGWIQTGDYLVLDTCTNHLKELESYSWAEDKDMPEDRNDHTINANQYGWIPYRSMIGLGEEKNEPLSDFGMVFGGIRSN